ncbi:MAG: hypothetical protein IKD03_05890, partial [Clostridia bacterium]|nr:hypothetical protein [Clostridia bacterium]
AVPANKRVRWGPRYYMDNDCINILLFKEEITVGYIVIEVKRDDTNTYNHSATVIQQSSVRMTVLELLIRNVF